MTLTTPAPGGSGVVPMFSFDALADRLSAQAFAVRKDFAFERYQLRLAAVKTGFELGKLGRVGRFVLGTEIEAPDIKTVQDFSSDCLDFADNNYYSKYSGGLVLCVPIVLYRRANEELQKWVEGTSAPKHQMAFEFSVVVCRETGLAHYYKKTPVWGAAYYRGFRKFVEEILEVDSG
jgi:hypothetical protein